MPPAEKAVVVSFDEKTQIQALGRTHANTPLSPAYASQQTRDYKRNGTTPLFAGLNTC